MITDSAYRKLIQTQRDIRDTNNDLYLSHEAWYIKVSSNWGQISTAINGNHPPHILLGDIINLAEVTLAWLEAYRPLNLFKKIRKEHEQQVKNLGSQNHSRTQWFLTISQMIGGMAEAIESNKPIAEIFPKIIQLSAILQIWTSSHDWFNE